MSDFNFTKDADMSELPVYSNEAYLNRVYLAMKHGYQIRASVVPFLVDDVRDILKNPSFPYDADFPRNMFLGAVADCVVMTGKKSPYDNFDFREGTVAHIMDSRVDFHADALFGDKSLSLDERQAVAKDFGDYIYNIYDDVSSSDRQSLKYASALLYMSNPKDANPFKSQVASRSIIDKTPTELLESSISEFNTFRQAYPKVAYPFIRFLGHDDVFLPEAFSDLRNEMSAKAEAYQAVMKAKAAEERVNPKRLSFDGHPGHALEDWSPNKGDNGFDFDESDYDDSELQ